MTTYLESKRKQIKAALIAFQPGVYWAYRKLRRGWAETEMKLLPLFHADGPLAIDVGANHGLFTHYLSRLCGQVHAFEASPRMADILRRGYLRRGNVHVHEVALSNQMGVATLRVPRFVGLSGYATVQAVDLSSKVDLSDGLDEIEVPTRALDEYDFRGVSFIKVDVEGHEQEVLEGARATLAREPAVVLAELENRHRPGAVRDVSALLAGLGYAGYFLRGQQLVDVAQFDPNVHQHEHGEQDYVRNFIFVAPARRASFTTKLTEAGFRFA